MIKLPFFNKYHSLDTLKRVVHEAEQQTAKCPPVVREGLKKDIIKSRFRYAEAGEFYPFVEQLYPPNLLDGKVAKAYVGLLAREVTRLEKGKGALIVKKPTTFTAIVMQAAESRMLRDLLHSNGHAEDLAESRNYLYYLGDCVCRGGDNIRGNRLVVVEEGR